MVFHKTEPFMNQHPSVVCCVMQPHMVNFVHQCSSQGIGTLGMHLHHAYQSKAEGGGSARPFFHLSICRWVDFFGGSICTIFPLNECYQDMSPPIGKTCLLSSPLSSMVPRAQKPPAVYSRQGKTDTHTISLTR